MMIRAWFAFFACLGLSQPASADPIDVDVELVLAVDVSRSMSMMELEIQRAGYASALTSPQVIDAILSGPRGRIALTYLEWAGVGNNKVVVDWTLIDSVEDAQIFADRLTADFSNSMRRTSISGAIDLSIEVLERNNFVGDRQVIDISGDGPNNHGRPVLTSRRRALDEGITINGLPLMTSEGVSWYYFPELDVYYRNCVIGGPGSFVIPVTEWDQFPEAVRRKLVLELASVPGTQIPLFHKAMLHVPQEPDYDCLIGEKIWEERRRRLWTDP